MARVLSANLNGCLYLHEIDGVDSVDEIAKLVHEPDVESLPSTSGQIHFWFSPLPQLRANRVATEILCAYTDFGAHRVPLLRGNVIITSRDPMTDEPAGLSDNQLDRLADARPRGVPGLVLAWRCTQELRRQLLRDGPLGHHDRDP